MMTRLFQRSGSQSEHASRPSGTVGPRIPRHSSGWKKLLEQLKAETGLRVLDIGPTSPNNINFLTSLGHSVYMADLVDEAVKPAWKLPPQEGEPQAYDTAGFLARHMNFGERKFDVVLLWDALDYIPQPMVAGILDKIRDSVVPRGQILAFFHARTTGADTLFSRYHVTEGDSVQMQEAGGYPVLCAYQNRQVEKLFSEFESCRFFLAKDNIREVVITR